MLWCTVVRAWWLADGEAVMPSSARASPRSDASIGQQDSGHHGTEKDSDVEGGGSPVNDGGPARGGGVAVGDAARVDLHAPTEVRKASQHRKGSGRGSKSLLIKGG
jgi:hypothetical protein